MKAAALVIAALPGLVAAAAAFGQLRELQAGQPLCDEAGQVCIDGTLSYAPNPRLLRLRGRVQRAAGAGLLRITLRGTGRQGDPRYAPMEIELRGGYSEIVDFKMIPDYPDVADWAVFRVEFEPRAR